MENLGHFLDYLHHLMLPNGLPESIFNTQTRRDVVLAAMHVLSRLRINFKWKHLFGTYFHSQRVLPSLRCGFSIPLV